MQTSSEKENKKVQTDKQFEDNDVREGQADNSIYNDENNVSTYPHKHAEDKQHKGQEK